MSKIDEIRSAMVAAMKSGEKEKKETYSALTKEIIKLAETRHSDISYADMKHVLEEEK